MQPILHKHRTRRIRLIFLRLELHSVHNSLHDAYENLFICHIEYYSFLDYYNRLRNITFPNYEHFYNQNGIFF